MAWGPSAPRRISHHSCCRVRAGISFRELHRHNLSNTRQPASRRSRHPQLAPVLASGSTGDLRRDTAPQTALCRDCTACRQQSKLYTERNTRTVVARFKLTNTLALAKPLTPGLASRLLLPSSAPVGHHSDTARLQSGAICSFATHLLQHMCPEGQGVARSTGAKQHREVPREPRGGDESLMPRAPRDSQKHIVAHLECGTQAGRAVLLTGRWLAMWTYTQNCGGAYGAAFIQTTAASGIKRRMHVNCGLCPATLPCAVQGRRKLIAAAAST